MALHIVQANSQDIKEEASMMKEWWLRKKLAIGKRLP
jgi:hypothetical protein